MILAFQCWIIDYMSKYLETWMYFAYVRRYYKKCFLIFQRWIICTYPLRFVESVSSQNPTMVADFYVSIGNYANRYLEFLRICTKIHVSIKVLHFRKYSKVGRLYYPKSPLGISAHVRKISTSLLRFGTSVSAQNPITMVCRILPRI